MNSSPSDTICAISTPVGAGAIGIVRLSGPQAIAMASGLFVPADGTSLPQMASHTLKFGRIVDRGQTVDEVLLALMRTPRSYTTEDMVEIHCHGGLAAVRAVLELVVAQGARLAEAGEFTRRAFVNGRIDLTQAKAVLEVIQARTRASLRSAANRLHGQLGNSIREASDLLSAACARLEASIDFPDEELGPEVLALAREKTRQAASQIETLINSADSGRLYRQGARVVLAGKPNVGKSSLFNQLVREARAIVTAEPGTTRDVLEETINIRGVPITLQDAAGLRDPANEPEIIGVQYAQTAIEQADLVVLVVDQSQGLTDEDRRAAQTISDLAQASLVVGNKTDLPSTPSDDAELALLNQSRILTSAQTGAGIEDLESAIADRVVGGDLLPPAQALVTSTRELECLTRAASNLESFAGALDQGMPIDVAAIDLHGALDALGDLVGQVTNEDLLDQIFGEFCIGK